jgi:hypothetical protein
MPAKAAIQYSAPSAIESRMHGVLIVRRCLSSGSHSADPLADDDGA